VRGAHRVAAHLLQHAQPEVLQGGRASGAHAGVVLVIAGALNLERFAVEEESLLRIELAERTPKVTRSASRTAPFSTVTIAV
jgi:hypothetical protein